MKRLACLTAVSALALLGAPRQADACGGCFVGPQESTVVTGHRMALAVSMERTVLWDQIEYAGDPAEFSWVLPVKPGARIAVGHDAWFDVLDAATQVVVAEPQVFCGGEFGGDDGGGFGCGDSDAAYEAGMSAGAGGTPKQDVTVTHQGTVGPYETVTLSTDVPGALELWLDEHGYNVPDEVQPTIDAYVAEGFDFIALRLLPDKGTAHMQPVRVTTKGASFALPLRMVAAGTGANTALTLFVLGEGRYETDNFQNVLVPGESISWNFNTSASDYSELRLEALAQNDGHSWLTSYAKQGTLLSPLTDPIAPMWNVSYVIGSTTAETIAAAYAWQGQSGGSYDTSCLSAFTQHASSSALVVDTCEGRRTCAEPEPGTIAASDFACGELDDVAVALTGMHPRDVWITRLEADLPRSALETDLALRAADAQIPVENRIVPSKHVNHPCDGQAAAAPLGAPKVPPRFPGGLVLLTLLAAALGWSARRRLGAAAEETRGA